MVVCSSDLASVGLLTVVDNAVEDGFKALCVWSHYSVGNLVGVAVFSTLRTTAPKHAPPGRAAVSFTSIACYPTLSLHSSS